MPYFTIFAVIFIVVFTIKNRSNTRKQADVNDAFWDKELKANATRKQDISQLDYITIPLDIFPLNLHTASEDKIKALSEEKILNLTGISNTDLKLTYGVANLEFLGECDANYADLIFAIGAYATELIENGQKEDAQKILEYAISIKADSGIIYTTLASIYKQNGQTDRIIDLIDAISKTDTLSQKTIIEKLNAYLP